MHDKQNLQGINIKKDRKLKEGNIAAVSFGRAESAGEGQSNVGAHIEKKNGFNFFYYLEILSVQYTFNIWIQCTSINLLRCTFYMFWFL